MSTSAAATGGAVETFVLDPGWVASLARYALTSPRPATVTTVTPMNGRPLARLPLSSVDDVDVAVTGARAAQRLWAQLPVSSRAQILLRFHDLLLAHQVEMLDLIQLEAGKTRLQAFAEIVHVAQLARFYARTAVRLQRVRRRPGVVPVLTHVVQMRQPKGVVGISGPWHYPLSLGLGDAIPALLAGNAVVVRPDRQASLSVLYGVHLLTRAGLPQRVVQVVLGGGQDIGQAVLDRADHVCFTGSVDTLRAVAHHAAQRLVSASLGGPVTNSMYVAADADLNRAVRGAISGGFDTAGQGCVASQRLIVHESVAPDFLARLIPAIRALRVGPQLTYDADVATLVSQQQLERVTAAVDQARARGAQVLTGGRGRPDLGPWFYEPTVVAAVTPDMDIYQGQTPGPVLSVHPVSGDPQALALANSGQGALLASVWTTDAHRGRVLAAAIRAGTVTVNDAYPIGLGSVAAPAGGTRLAGLGRRHGVEGFDRFTDSKTVARQRRVPLRVPAGMDQQRFAALATAGLRVSRWVGRI